MDGDCFRLLNLASSLYLTLGSEGGATGLAEDPSRGAVSSLRLCARGDAEGMANSYFKLLTIEEDDDHAGQKDATFSSVRSRHPAILEYLLRLISGTGVYLGLGLRYF